MGLKFKTGIYDGIPSKDYHKVNGVSNSYLSRLNKCPAAAKAPAEDSNTLIFGRAVHSYVLEGPEAFFKEFAVVPECDRRTKEGKVLFAEFQAACGDKDLITSPDFDKLIALRDAVYAHPFARAILAEGQSEQSVFWADDVTGLDCKCRPDRIPAGGKGVLVDLKTTTDSGEYGFGRSVTSYGYARQAAFYLDGINAATGSEFDSFIFVAIEKEAPYRVETYLLDESFIEYGRADYRRLLEIEAYCRDHGYPNYQTPELVTLYKPKYI